MNLKHVFNNLFHGQMGSDPISRRRRVQGFCFLTCRNFEREREIYEKFGFETQDVVLIV